MSLHAFHILAASKKHVETCALEQIEKRTVLKASPLHVDDGVNIMLGQEPRQLAPEMDASHDNEE